MPNLRCHECSRRAPAPTSETWDAGACVPVYTCPECGARGDYSHFDPAYPIWDESIGEYVADDENGREHFGQDFWQCQDAVAEANRVALAHAQKCGDPMQPDYESLAAREPVTQNSDSRDSTAF